MNAGTLTVRAVTEEHDLETWTRIRNLAEPDAPSTLEDVRASLRREPDTGYWLAELDGRGIGCAFASRSSVPGRGFVLPRVPADERRRGAGSALLAAALAHVAGLGRDWARSHVDGDDLAAVAFAVRHGFVEVDRQVELVRPVAEPVTEEAPPAGIRLAELPAVPTDELRTVVAAGVADMPVVGGLDDSLVDELVEEFGDAVFRIGAFADGALVGLAGLQRYGARTDALEHAFTTVLPAHRGRGLAVALKAACVVWATGAGYAELVTWTQSGNDAMQAVNTKAGFRPGQVSLTVERRLG